MILVTTPSAEYSLKILKWIAENLNWVAPLIITLLFSCLNLHMAKVNSDAVKEQIKLQNDSFRYELFDRRYELYKNLQKTLDEVTCQRDRCTGTLSRFLFYADQVPILFGEDVKKKMDEVSDLLRRYYVDGKTELKPQLESESRYLIKVFENYISFKDYKIKPTEKVKK